MTCEGDTIQPTTSRSHSQSCQPTPAHITSPATCWWTTQLLPQFSQEQLHGWGDKMGCVMGKNENTHRSSSFFCSHMGGKRKHHQVLRQCALSNCLLPNRGTSRAIPAGLGCHKIRKNCTTGDWSKPVVMWTLFAHLAADEWAWTEPHLRNENRTQGRQQYSIFTGKQWKMQWFWQNPTETTVPKEMQSPISQTRCGFPDWKYSLMVSTSNPQDGLSRMKI